MRGSFTFAAILAIVLGIIATGAQPAQAATCLPTGFQRDGIEMTAAIINPARPVRGLVDALGCHIGVYVDRGRAEVKDATIRNAQYFGVLVNGDVGTPQADVKDSTITDIGNRPLDGSQHGVAIYYRAFGTGTTSGEVAHNRISRYQKGGIVANGAGTRVSVTGNTVAGQGAIDWIAQNGIQIGYGARATVTENRVSGNAYSGTWGASSGGIIVVGGPLYGGDYTVDTKIEGNVLEDNDVGIYLSNLSLDAPSYAPATPTNVKVSGNKISSRAFTNRYPYQAGISDVGNGDRIEGNAISGAGYDAAAHPGAAFDIDADASSYSPNVRVNGNRCSPDPTCNGWSKASPVRDERGGDDKGGKGHRPAASGQDRRDD